MKKTIPKYVNDRNYTLEPKKGYMETTEGQSETIPGEAYTIQDIFERSRRGILPDAQVKQGLYNEDPTFDSLDMEKIRHLDFTEIDQAKLDILEEEIQIFRDKQKEAEEKDLKTKSIESENDPEPKAKKIDPKDQ